MNYKEKAKKIVSQMTLEEKIGQLSHEARGIERLGIPRYNWWNEGLHGVGRSGTATVFPQAIALAAIFDEDFLHKVAGAISDEFRAKYNEYAKMEDRGIYKGLTVWSPNINIFRDPRWGRGHETYGEDPFLTSRLGAAFVKGLQGDDEDFHKTDATLKHFAAHSGPEAVRHTFDSSVSQKDLNETYLYAFKHCIKNAGPAAVMGAYTSVNGDPCVASKKLIQEILREQLGFEGYFVSDCGAICDLYQHRHIAGDRAEAAALAINAGCDLCCGVANLCLLAAYERGIVSEDTITESAERLMEARLRLGLGQKTGYDNIPYSAVACEKHRELSLEAALKSAVLLKNNGLLPLKPQDIRVSVTGPNADDTAVLVGNYNGIPLRDITLLEGIQDYLKGRGEVLYSIGCHLTIPEDKIGEWKPKHNTEAVINARHSHVVIACVGLSPALEGEEGDAFNSDAGGDKLTLELPPSQRELLDKLYATGKPVIVVNISGSAVLLNEDYEKAAAIIQMFYPGESGGAALAGIIFGNCSPSGKLPVTFYASDSQLPEFSDYSMKGRTYRYLKQKPLFPFGYGLSYANIEVTGCEISDISFDNETSAHVRAELQNNSDIDAEEVLQIYSRRLADCGVVTPNYKLCGFKRILLKAHEKTEIILKAEEAFSFYNEQGQAEVLNGDYELFIGTSQPDERSGELTGKSPCRLRVSKAKEDIHGIL